MLLFASLLAIVSATLLYSFVHADPAVTSTDWPNNLPLPSRLYSHGNNSVTATNHECLNYYQPGSTLSAVTLTDDGDTSSAIPKISADNYQTQPCYGSMITGRDNTTYTIQTSHNANDYTQRVVATRDNETLWTRSFGPIDCNDTPAIRSLTLGYDDDIYADVDWPGGTNCPARPSLVGIESATGEVKFNTQLPGPLTPYSSEKGDTLLPYETGIAVTNNGANVYYYSYNGVQDTTKTFSPLSPGTPSMISQASISPSGRVYLIIYNSTATRVVYKDITSTTIGEVSLQTGHWPQATYPGPNNSVAIRWATQSFEHGLSYFDLNDSETFSRSLHYEPGLSLIGAAPGIAMDNLGNVIVLRTMYSTNVSPSEQYVFIDSFSPNGTKTTLFNSNVEFGTTGQDKFTAGILGPQNLGDGKIFIQLCHYVGSSQRSICSAIDNPKLVTVPMTSSFDSLRSGIYAAQSQKLNYVALGDSFSSGEGLPPFIQPSANNDCDRSASAYPGLLINSSLFSYNPALDLRAFRACSGSTTAEIYTGKNGEQGQTASLSSETDLVTITAGGNDIGFSNLAEECIIGTCDSSSSQYQDATDQIDNYLQDNLELLFGRIRDAAPNATVYVLGYPNVVPTGTACSVIFSTGEAIAINTIITSLNTKLHTAVQNSGSGFSFLDPTALDSPFTNHELCTQDPYFFGLNIAEHRFSFHPNAGGQAAYAQMVNDELGI